MKRTYITFSGARYHDWTKRIVEDAPGFGADQVLVYDDHWLTTQHPEFIEKIKHLLFRPDMRGFGWFAWKPFIILDALKRCGDGDVVLYTDADTYPIHDLGAVFDTAARDGMMLFKCVGQIHKWWCKRSCYAVMGIATDPYDPRYYDVPHGCARFMAFRNDQASRDFLEEWLHFCCILDATTFEPSPAQYGPENPELKEHRTEQAIFTNVAYKRGQRLYREACQFGESVNDDRDLFPQLFFQNGMHTWDPAPKWAGSRFRNV